MREVAQTSSEEVLKPARAFADSTKAALEKTKGSIAQVESSTKKAVEQAHEELKEKTPVPPNSRKVSKRQFLFFRWCCP